MIQTDNLFNISGDEFVLLSQIQMLHGNWEKLDLYMYGGD